MKKKMLPALLICLAMLSAPLLSGCAPDARVVGRVGRDALTVKESLLVANYLLLQYGMTRADLTGGASQVQSLNRSALSMLVNYKLVMQQAKAKGFYPFSADSKKQADSLAQQIASQADGFGMTQADFDQLATWQEASRLVEADATKSITVSDDEIKAEYDKEVASEKASYDANASAYESAESDGSTVIVYRPAGYRYVKHILITMPDDIASQISSAQSSGDTATEDSLKEKGLKQIQSKAEEVLAKVRAGGDFDDLIAQYGGDPGMKPDQPTGKTGYEVGKDTTSYVTEFKDAAMALAKVGDTSDLVGTDFGYHIIKYISDVTAGPVPLADVKDSLKAVVLTNKINDAWNNALQQWESQVKIEQHPEWIPVVVSSSSSSGQ